MPPNAKPASRKPTTKKTAEDEGGERRGLCDASPHSSSYHITVRAPKTTLTHFFTSTECSAKFGYRESDAQDGKSVSWLRTIQSVCFTTAFLKSIMGGAYHHIVTYNDVAQEIQEQEKKVHPDSKLYWGAPQLACLKWECTGTPPITKVQLQHQLRQQCRCERGRRW